MLKCEGVTVGAFEVNCWLLYGEARMAIVIDPGAEVATIENHLAQRRLGVAAYICTHGHCDHVSALAGLRRKHPAPVAMHPADAKWAFSPDNSFEPEYPEPESPGAIDRPLKDGDSFKDGGISWKTIATPGHSPGGICIYVDEQSLLFTGDTLFAGSVGRTDLPGGNSRILAASLRNLVRLPENTVVYPGHGPETTIGRERQTNFFLSASPATWEGAR